MDKRLNSQKGQALLETLASFLALKVLVVAFLFLAYQITLTKLVDFWAYRTLICLIESEQRHPCQKTLEEKLSLFLSSKNFRIQELWLTRNSTKISLQVHQSPFGVRNYEKQIPLPLSADSMHEALH